MSTLLQILIAITVLVTLYAVVVHNRKDFELFLTLLPDFTKLNPLKRTKFVKVVVFASNSHAEAVRRVIGKIENLEKERIEVTVSRKNLKNVIHSIQGTHLPKDTVIDVYPIEEIVIGH